MCGRFALSLAHPDDVARAVSVPGSAGSGANCVATWQDAASADVYEPRPEVRPTTHVPVAYTNMNSGASACAEPGTIDVTVQFMRWGLVPSFANSTFLKSGNPPLINARGESVLEKPSFRSIKAKSGSRRCVVVTSGYMEWYTYPEEPGARLNRSSGKKQIPYLIHRPYSQDEGGPKPLLLAGVYDSWKGGEEGVLWSFALVTMAANSELSWLHHRQPVFLTSDEALRNWLDPSCSPERACEIAFSAADACKDLEWTRLLKDLSAPAAASQQGIPKPLAKFAPIDSFFSRSSGEEAKVVVASKSPHPTNVSSSTRYPNMEKQKGVHAAGSQASKLSLSPVDPVSDACSLERLGTKVREVPRQSTPRPTNNQQSDTPTSSVKRAHNQSPGSRERKMKQRRIGEFFEKK